jgi:hypothetical protein
MNGNIRLPCQSQQVSQTLVTGTFRNHDAVNCSLSCTERFEHWDEPIDLIAMTIDY